SIIDSIPRPATSPLFPYTTLFRSHDPCRAQQLEPEETSHRGRHRVTNLSILRCHRTREPHDIWEALSARRLSHRDDPILRRMDQDRKSTRLNSSHVANSYAVFCLK